MRQLLDNSNYSHTFAGKKMDKIFQKFNCKMKLMTNVLRSLVLLSALFSLSAFAQTAEEGATLFTANCTACHAMNEKVVGPALKDSHKRHDEKWMMSWIRNSQKLIKSGDAVAVKLFNDNNQSPMTPFEQFNDNQLKSLIAYIKSESEKPAAAATASVAGSETNVAAAPAEVSSTMKGKINWLLIIIAVLLFMVIALVMDILGMVGEIRGKAVINWSSINGIIMLLFVGVGMSLAIWEVFAHGKYAVTSVDAASEHGKTYDSMFYITLVITGIVFVITQIVLFYYAYKYKQDGKRKALYYPDNHKLEFIWTIVPAIVLTVLVIRGLQTWSTIMNHKDEKAINIEVFGYQFGWTARYAGTDNKLGSHDFRQIGVVNALGVDIKDEKSKDDIVVTELHFPVNKPVALKFRAKDVIHSAYLPHFRVQMNVVPGLPTQFEFTPTITTAEMRNKMNNQKFDYILLCNKICGSAHYRMKMKVIVDSEADYNKWLATQPKLVDSSNPAPEAPVAAPVETKDHASNAVAAKKLASK